MKKLLLTILVLQGLLQIAGAWSYPLKQVSKPGCKFEIWQNLTQDCKMNLPIIKNADYKKYKDNLTYRLTYSVLWLSTYKNGWDIGYGSHLGVDIASSLGTPVYSIGNGIVEKAEYLKGRGNTVVIKHKLPDGKYIWSIYAHLNKINVKKGQNVKEGQKIGEIGHSGYAWGNHVHFQIDINPNSFHPYYYNDCGNPTVVVNKGLCQDKVIANTIDPIKFLETNSTILPAVQNPQYIYQHNQKIVKQEKIKPTEIIPRQKLMLTELELFLARYKFSFKKHFLGGVIYKGQSGKITIFVKNRYNKPFKGVLPQDLKVIITNPKVVKVFPTSIKYIENGQRTFTIYGKDIGTTDILFQIDEKTLYRTTVRVIDKTTSITPSSAYGIITSRKPHIGDEIWAVAIFRDKSFNNIINVPLKGNYIAKISGGVGCLVKISLSQLYKLKTYKCYTKNSSSIIRFSYPDTLKGIVLLKLLPTKPYQPLKVEIFNSQWKKLGEFKTFYNISYPTDLTRSNYHLNRDYLPYIKNSLKNLITRNYKIGKFVPDFKLKKSDAIYWVKNLKYKLLGDDTLYRIPPGNDYQINRLDFVKLISNNLNLYSSTNKKIFWDTKSEDWKYTNILYDINSRFLDQFGNKFFQPDKTITRQEAAYILEKIYEYYKK